MRRVATAVMILLGTLFSVSSSRAAEDTWDYSVRVDSVVEEEKRGTLVDDPVSIGIAVIIGGVLLFLFLF